MDLLEYQAKELFREIGIPVLPSQCIHDARELKKLHIPYPVVLKSQVRVGGRGRAGGIRFVENTIDAIAAARAIFNLPILNQYPEVILAEARYNAKQEFFLAVLLDYQRQCPVLLGSARGGMDIEVLLDNMQTVVIEDQFSSFYARKLALKMGLQGSTIESISLIIQKMYQLFYDWDLDLIEINPLGISEKGELMALDGKITVNDYALSRNPEIELLISPHLEAQDLGFDQSAEISNITVEPKKLDWFDDQGNIGLLCYGLDSAISTWDLLVQNKGFPNSCFLINHNFQSVLLDAELNQILEQSLQKLKNIKNLKVILVNIVGNQDLSETIAEAIANYLTSKLLNIEATTSDRLERPTAAVSRIQRGRSNKSGSTKKTTSSNQNLQWVIRLVGGNLNPIKEKLVDLPVYWTENLEEAINKSISLAKTR